IPKFAANRRFGATNRRALQRRVYRSQRTLVVMFKGWQNRRTRWIFALTAWPAIGLAVTVRDYAVGAGSAGAFAFGILGNLGFLAPIVALATLAASCQRYRRREQEWTADRLQVLEAQLHPHFLFNTLNSIATLMHEDVDAADEMMAKLATLLRRTLNR